VQSIEGRLHDRQGLKPRDRRDSEDATEDAAEVTAEEAAGRASEEEEEA